ncbi:MAG: CAP domain-containing protein [Acidobacteriota bacterium]
MKSRFGAFRATLGLMIPLIAAPVLADCRFNNGQVVEYEEGGTTQDGSVDWREARVMGSSEGAACTYSITGPGGMFDYTNRRDNIPEARLRRQQTQPIQTTKTREIDPATIDLRKLEQEIVAETNRAREKPQDFAATIRTKIEGNYTTKTIIGQDQLWVTLPDESPSAYLFPTESTSYKNDVTEAINTLQAAAVGKTLAWSSGLAMAARDHSSDPGIVGHTGGDGSDFLTRIARYGRNKGGAAENLGAGHTTAFGFVSSFLVDYRVPGRGHRTNILNANYNSLGVGCHYFAPAAPQDLGFIRCVMNFGFDYATNAIPPAADLLYLTDADGDSVQVIDTAGEKTVKTIGGLGKDLRGVAVGPYGRKVYVVSKDQLHMIDASRDYKLVKSWRLPYDGLKVAVSPDGNTVFVSAMDSAAGKGYILPYSADSSLPDNLIAETPVQAGIQPLNLSVGRNGRRLYVQESGSPLGGFYLDLANNYSRHSLNMNGPMFESGDGSRLIGTAAFLIWSAEVGSWQPATLDGPNANEGFVGGALCPDGNFYATSMRILSNGNSRLVSVDPAGGRAVTRFELPGWGAAVGCTLDGKKVFVGNLTGVYVVDIGTWAIRTLTTGKQPSGMAIGPAPVS